MSEMDLQHLAAGVQYIKDRLAIEDRIHRHARGHDRFDIEIMSSCYHPDGIDAHGAAAINSAAEYGEMDVMPTVWKSATGNGRSPYSSAADYIKGVRGKRAVCYMRPLTLEGEVERL